MYANNIEKRMAYITLIAVKPEAQHNHVGSKLLEMCEKTALQKEMYVIELEVSRHNICAIKFYEKNGFVYAGDVSPNTFYMKKILK